MPTVRSPVAICMARSLCYSLHAVEQGMALSETLKPCTPCGNGSLNFTAFVHDKAHQATALIDKIASLNGVKHADSSGSEGHA
jgi:hypothetical protein